MRLIFLLSAPLFLAACATAPGEPTGPRSDSANAMKLPSRAESGVVADTLAPQGPPQAAPPRPSSNGWRPGEAALTGYLGASFLTLDTSGGGAADINDEDISAPVIGGGGQWKLAGDNIDFGLEALLSFSWRGDVAAVAIGGGGAAVAVDVNLLIWDVFAGPFVSIPLANRARIYVGAGPLLRWTIYDQDGPTTFTSGDGDGFGVGWYARTGVEFAISRGTMIGVGARWTDVEVDLNGRLGDLDAHGIEALFTVTQGF